MNAGGRGRNGSIRCVFHPERNESRPRWAYFPFGGGSRQCVGEAFAWAEATLAVATLAKRWRMTALSESAPALEPGITLRPKGEIRMKLHARR